MDWTSIALGISVAVFTYLATWNIFSPVGDFMRSMPRSIASPRQSWNGVRSEDRHRVHVAQRWGAIPFAVVVGVYAATGMNLILWGAGLGGVVGFAVWNGLQKRALAAKYPEAE